MTTSGRQLITIARWERRLLLQLGLTKEISAECIPAKHSGVQERCGRRFTEEGTVVIRKPSEMTEAIVKCSIGDGMCFAAI
jgi:hypothetical protein